MLGPEEKRERKACDSCWAVLAGMARRPRPCRLVYRDLVRSALASPSPGRGGSCVHRCPALRRRPGAAMNTQIGNPFPGTFTAAAGRRRVESPLTQIAAAAGGLGREDCTDMIIRHGLRGAPVRWRLLWAASLTCVRVRQVRDPGAAAAGRRLLPLRRAEPAGRAPAEKIGGPRRVYVSTESPGPVTGWGAPQSPSAASGLASVWVPRGIESLLKPAAREGNCGGGWSDEDGADEGKGTFQFGPWRAP